MTEREWSAWNNTSARLPARPFVDGWLRNFVSQFETLKEPAEIIGVDPSHLRRMLNGEHKYVGEDLVDRAACRAEGNPYLLYELYPERTRS